MFTLSFGVLLSALLLGAGGAIFGAVGGRIDRLTADGAALSRPFPHHVGQQLMVGGKHRVSEPVAQQRVGNTLYADATEINMLFSKGCRETRHPFSYPQNEA